MAEKIIGIEVKSLTYGIEDTETKSIAENALAIGNRAFTKAEETASAFVPVAQSVAEIEANIGENDISEIKATADTALEEAEEIPAIKEKIGDVDISGVGDSVTDAISKMNEIIGNVSGAVYSTEEKAVGRWIDGKIVYQKTILTGQLPNETSKIINPNIENIGHIISFEGSTRNTAGTMLPIPYVNPEGLFYSISIAKEGNNIKIITGTDRSNFTWSQITMKYTKTTD